MEQKRHQGGFDGTKTGPWSIARPANGMKTGPWSIAHSAGETKMGPWSIGQKVIGTIEDSPIKMKQTLDC